MIGLVADAVTQALMQLRAHWDRALLTLFGITWGTAAMVALVSWGGGMRTMIGRDMRKLGDNLMYMWPSAARIHEQNALELRTLEVELDEIAALDGHVANARHVIPELPTRMVVRRGNRTLQTLIIGVVPETAQVRKFDVTAGRFINEADMRMRRRVCLLCAEAETQLFQGADPIGRKLTIDGVPFTVIGRLRDKGNQMMDMNGPDNDKVLIPATTGETYFGDMRYVHQFIVQLDDPTEEQETIASVRHRLAAAYRFDRDDEDAVQYFNTTRVIRLADFATNAIRIFVGFVGAGTLLVAGLGVMNVMLISVRERTPEVGLRLAIGGRPVDVFLQFLVESLVVTTVGGMVGITLALGLCMGFASLNLPPQVPVPEISWGAVVAALVTMTVVGLAAGTWPAYQAAKLDPVTALRYE